MGSSYSEPVQNCSGSDLGIFAISLYSKNKILLVQAPEEVVSLTKTVVNRVSSLYNNRPTTTETKILNGVPQYQLDFSAFSIGNNKSEATMSKVFCIQMIEELYKTGYDVILCSDLSRMKDKSTWFLKKVTCERPGKKIICIAPSKSDSIALLNHDERIKTTVIEAITETWPKGISDQNEKNVLGQQLTEIKMNGYPWEGKESEIDSKRLLSRLVSKMGGINLEFLIGINIKGGTDTLFFMEDFYGEFKSRPNDFCTISLCSQDRLRLVDCKDMADDIRQTILDNGNKIQDESTKEYHHKFKIKGTPWWSSGDEAVKSRQLISRIGETMLKRGWALTKAVDLNRKMDDKSVLMYKRCQPTSAKFSCIAFTDVDHLRLLDFTGNDKRELINVITKNYMPGIDKFDEPDSDCAKVYLNGSPWDTVNGYAVHAKSMLVHLLAKTIKLGYMVVASADVSAKYMTDSDGNPMYPLDVDTWYFAKYNY